MTNNFNWKKEWDEYCDKYQLFSNENYGDNMPYDLQKKTVEDFISLVEQKVREEERTKSVSRVEVIDHTKSFEEGGGRCYVKWQSGMKVELSEQDDGKTLKIFIT